MFGTGLLPLGVSPIQKIVVTIFVFHGKRPWRKGAKSLEQRPAARPWKGLITKLHRVLGKVGAALVRRARLAH